MAERDHDRPVTPALVPIPTGTAVMAVLLLLTLAAWAMGWGAVGTFAGLTIAWFLFFVVGTAYAFHRARKAGEWPPRDGRDA